MKLCIILTLKPHHVSFSLSFGVLVDQIPGSWGCSAFPTIHLLSLASHLETNRKWSADCKQTKSGFSHFQMAYNQGQSYKFLKVTRLEMEMKINDFPLRTNTYSQSVHVVHETSKFSHSFTRVHTHKIFENEENWEIPKCAFLYAFIHSFHHK